MVQNGALNVNGQVDQNLRFTDIEPDAAEACPFKQLQHCSLWHKPHKLPSVYENVAAGVKVPLLGVHFMCVFVCSPTRCFGSIGGCQHRGREYLANVLAAAS